MKNNHSRFLFSFSAQKDTHTVYTVHIQQSYITHTTTCSTYCILCTYTSIKKSPKHISLGCVTKKTHFANETRASHLKLLRLVSHTHKHTHREVGVKPFKLNEGLMIDWEWLLQLVIVIVKPLTVSLYNHHKIIDRDRCG